MDSVSTKPNKNETTSSLQADIEALKNIDKEISESIQAELQEADSLFEKARASLSKLDDKDVCWLKFMKLPSSDVLGVLFACMHLMAGHVPKTCILVDEKNSPIHVTWGECKMMLNDWRLFRKQMLGTKQLIDEGKMYEENMVKVKGYLSEEWFKPEEVLGESMSASLFCDAVGNIVGYFDAVKEIRKKINTALGRFEEGDSVAPERED